MRQTCIFLRLMIVVGLVVVPCRAQNKLVAATASNNEGTVGTVVGVVIDVSNAQPLPKVSIEVIGVGQLVQTDLDGNFTIKVEPGTYQVRAARDGYQAQVIEHVVVTAKATVTLEVALSPQGMTLGEVEVRAEHTNGATEIAMLAERKAATSLSDAISAREISKDTSSDAAGVLQRVVGISVVQDKFVYVRGLGERYSNTVLNDAVLPTTEPDRRVVPMDLIPASLLDNIKVLKSFTPDQPGEFSGGLVKIQATEFPSQSTLKVSTSYGFNSLTSFKDFQTYPGDRLDWLGFGSGRRALPGVIPDQRVVRGSMFAPGFTPQQLETFGEAFENIWQPRNDSAAPNQGYSVSGATTIGKLGFVGALFYNNKNQNLDENRVYYQVASGDRLIGQHIYATLDSIRRAGAEDAVLEVVPEEFISDQFLRGYQSSSNTVRIGGTANVAYKLTPNHKLLFKNFYTHDGSDEVRIFQGYNDDRSSVLRNTRLRFIEEEIYSGQVSGDHLLSKLGDSLLTWRLTYSHAALDEPDLRESLYEFNRFANTFVLFFDQPQSLFRLFNQMDENVREPAFDWSKFFFRGKTTINLKAGAAYSNRDRGFDSRRFRFFPRNLTSIDTSLPPEQLLDPANIRSNGIELREETRNTDAYTAIHDITASYGMIDFTFNKWRIIGGARVEDSDQQVLTFDPFNPTLNVIRAGQKRTDVLPSIGIVYSLTPNMNLRSSYSQTVSRPQFRELSPFEFTDVTGGRSTVGNPNLVRALIRNFDARWEWFVTSQELIAVSVFYKNLKNPIEQVIEPTAQLRTSFRNAESARNWGLEFEVRKNLAFLSPRLENLSVQSNYTFVDSTIKIGQQDLSVLTTLERPLAGQSRHVFNGVFQYEIPRWGFEARALFNYVGERINDVGALGQPDIFEEGYPSLDLNFSKRFLGEAKKLELKFSAENLIDREVRFTQGGLPFWNYKRGRTFGVGVSYTIF